MNSGSHTTLRSLVCRRRGTPFILMCAAVVCMAAMLIIYSQTGISTFTAVLSQRVMILVGISIALGTVLCVFEIKTAKYCLYLLELWAWLEYLIYEASYISNVFVGIDGNSFSIGFILTAVTGLMGWLLTLISAIKQRGELCDERKA